MKSITRLAGIIGSVFIFGSCAFHSGMMTSNASLSGNDFEILSIESGTAKTTHIFGFGGLNHQALVFEAKKNMYRSSPLKKGQAFANVSVDFKRSYFPIVRTTYVTITADLVQFGNIPDTTLQQGFYQFTDARDSKNRKTIGTYLNSGYFESNQIAYVFKKKSFIPVRIINGIENQNERYNVTFLPPSTKREKFIKRSDLYLKEEPASFPNHDYHIGDAVKLLDIKYSTSPTGIIIAIGADKAIVQTGVFSIFSVELTKLQKIESNPAKNSQ